MRRIAQRGSELLMDPDRIPALHLTLDHYLPLAGGDWVRVTGLTLAGSDVVVAIGPDSSFRVPAAQPVRARLSGALADPTEEVEAHLGQWYAGDLPAAERAVDSHDSDSTPRSARPRVAYGHPVPELVRDRSLVGIFGGDLDAVLDTLGAEDSDTGRARERRAEAQKGQAEGQATHEDGSPPDPLPDELVSEQLASFYGGDLDALPRRRSRDR